MESDLSSSSSESFKTDDDMRDSACRTRIIELGNLFANIEDKWTQRDFKVCTNLKDR